MTQERQDSLNVALDFQLEIEPLLKTANETNNFNDFLDVYTAIKDKIKTAPTAGQRETWQKIYDKQFKKEPIIA